MKKHTLLYVSMAGIFALSAAAWAMTGEEAVSKLKARFYSANTMRGTITISSSTGDNSTGTFQYMAPGRFLIQFSTPPGKTIVTNGKKLWVYDKASNACGVQDVAPSTSGGIAGYISGYLPMASSGGNDTVIRLRNSSRAYKDITIHVDSSFMPRKILFKEDNGKGFSATLSNVITNCPMTPGIFDFDVPSGTQLVKNPLDVR